MGGIVGIGLDVAGVARFEKILAGPNGTRFLERCFTENERASCNVRVDRAQAFAARFAAKEALVKALGAPPGLHWTDMEVASSRSGAPTFKVTGAAARQVKKHKAKIHLAITHDAGIAAATVVLERTT
jgi:holo-[acyl-carrier protein] synthase